MSNLGTFRDVLAGYLTRNVADFVFNGTNLFDRAVNGARKWAERQHRFECARVGVVLRGVSLSDGGDLRNCVNVRRQGEKVLVRTIERAYLLGDPDAKVMMEVVSRDADMRDTLRSSYPLVTENMRFRLVRFGDSFVYISPFDTQTTGQTKDVYMDVIRWLPDYKNPEDTDFFLDHCEDFMLLRSLVQLNFFLKEDQRVWIAAKALEDSWNTVLKADTDAVAGASDDTMLE